MERTGRKDIEARIPHRPPFLWVDEIISVEDSAITTRKMIGEDLDVFKGHYPDNPIMPGVLLCEAIFQTGALLMSHLPDIADGEQEQSVPVITRIEGAKFKRMVKPGDELEIHVKIREKVSSVYFLRGTVRVRGKVTTQADFACAMAGTS